MCDTEDFVENAGDTTAEVSKTSKSAKYNLRIKLRRTVVDTSNSEEDEAEENSVKSVGEGNSEWRKKLIRHERHGTLDMFRKQEKERHLNYLQSITPDRKSIIREQTRQRVARHRAKGKEEGQSGTRSAVAAWEANKQAQRKTAADNQRRRRAALTSEERAALNKRRREQYVMNKAAKKTVVSSDSLISTATPSSTQSTRLPPSVVCSDSLISTATPSSTQSTRLPPSVVCSDSLISTATPSSTQSIGLPPSLKTPLPSTSTPSSTPSLSSGSPYKTHTAIRKAYCRTKKKSQAKNPTKFAQLALYQLQMAMKSPRKRQALADLGISITPPNDRAESTVVRSLKETLDSLKSQKDKASIEQRKFLVQAVSKSAINISSVSKQLSQRWHFVQKASTTSLEKEEMNKFRSNSIPFELQKEVQDYYQRPESATWIPDRKQVKKDLVPRMVLKKTLKRLHKDFTKETAKHISLSSFTRLRPQLVLTVDKAKHTSCVCEQCANISHKCDALKPILQSGTTEFADVESVCATTLYSTSTLYQRPECLERKCKDCGVDTLMQNMQSLPLKQKIVWLHWEKDSKCKTRKVNITKQGTIGDLVKELLIEMAPMAMHLHVAKWQYRMFRQLREQLPKHWILTLMDFAENYRCELQDEIQAAHWSYEQATVFPTVSYYKCPDCETSIVTESAVFISPDISHDADAVLKFTQLLAQHLLEKRNLSVIQQVQFTDGAASQFKSKSPFLDLSNSEQLLGFPVERSFFGSSHGKGPCDGIGGMAKSATRRAVLAKTALVRNAQEMYEYLAEHYTSDEDKPCEHSKRVFFYVGEIERKARKVPKNPLPHTRKQHCVKGGRSPGAVKARNLSCYCQQCLSSSSGCEQAEHVKPWIDHTFTFGKELQSPASPSPSQTSEVSLSKELPKNRRKSSEAVRNSKEPSAASPSPVESAVQFQDDEQERDLFFQKMQCEMCSAPSFAGILDIAQRYEEPMKTYPINCQNLVADSFTKDETSQALYPTDGPALTPVKIYGDGNCLPRCGSLLAFGHEEKHVEIRMRLACELALKSSFYLNDECLNLGMDKPQQTSKFYATYSLHYKMEELTPTTIRELYQMEVEHWVKNGVYAGMWEVHALSSVLGTSLHCIYPQYGGFNVRPHLHRIVFPRQTASDLPHFVPGIMWTSTRGSADAPIVWAPNHFVACLPALEASVSNYSSSSYIDQLKPGDFIKVKVPKENGTAVDFIAQVTQQTDGTITGRYLKPWGTSSWKFTFYLVKRTHLTRNTSFQERT